MGLSEENIDLEDAVNESKKNRKKRSDTESSQEIIDQEDSKRKSKKKKQKPSVSEEESDPIDTDMQEDEEILTPHEQGLLDMTDCSTLKHYKKRISALQKSIDARDRRVRVIDGKIESIEEKGLTAKNKKYHTAMHSEKLIIQERTKKLQEALHTAQENLNEMGYEKNNSYKEEQKKRKREKVKVGKENKKEEVKEGVEKEKKIKNEVTDKIQDIKVVKSLEPALEVPSAKDFWSANTDVLLKNVQEDESSSSEDEVNNHEITL